jgi:hypothetical protein
MFHEPIFELWLSFPNIWSDKSYIWTPRKVTAQQIRIKITLFKQLPWIPIINLKEIDWVHSGVERTDLPTVWHCMRTLQTSQKCLTTGRDKADGRLVRLSRVWRARAWLIPSLLNYTQLYSCSCRIQRWKLKVNSQQSIPICKSTTTTTILAFPAVRATQNGANDKAKTVLDYFAIYSRLQ